MRNVIGAVVLVVVLVLALPVFFALNGGAIAATLGFFLKKNGEEVNEGSELIELNR